MLAGSCPAEAGGLSSTLRLTCGQLKDLRKLRPPGQPQVLVVSEGLSELPGSTA